MLISTHTYRSGNPMAFNGWKKRMQTARTKPIVDNPVLDLLRERGLREDVPFLPRSVFEPQQLWTALELYSRATGDNILADKNIQYGIRVAKRVFQNPYYHQGRFLTPAARPEIYLDLSKSAGLPTLKKKMHVSIEDVKSRIEAIRKGAVPAPCLAQARTQKNNKTRLVWGYPYEMTYLEQVYASKLIRYFNDRATPMTTGAKKIEIGVRLSSADYQDHVTALDYSKFDTSIPAPLIREAFKIIKTYFSPDAEHDFQIIERYFIFTPIVMPDGKIYRVKKQGVPSGSSFTQMIDSIVNLILSHALDRRFNLGLKNKHLFVLGDDALMFTKKQVDKKLLRNMAQWLGRFGFKINEDKTKIGLKHYLGATWEHGLRQRPQSEILANLVYPENVRSYPSGDRYSGANLTLAATLTDSMQSTELVADKRIGQLRAVFDNAFSWGATNNTQFEGYMRFLRFSKVKSERMWHLYAGFNKVSSVTRAYTS